MNFSPKELCFLVYIRVAAMVMYELVLKWGVGFSYKSKI